MLIALIAGFFSLYTPQFRLDASAESLTLENDKTLEYYRLIRDTYGSDDYLILTYSPTQPLFSKPVLDDIAALSQQLSDLELVESVVSLLDIPLLKSPPVTINQFREKVRTLKDADANYSLAREELQNSSLYQNLIISPDGKTTALQIILPTLPKIVDSESKVKFDKRQRQEIANIRLIMAQYSDRADLHLGGVPMITSDSIDFIEHDLVVFGAAVTALLLLLLSMAFRKLRWVFIPLLTCLVTGVITIGFLGMVDWPVTVVSANFISLLLIITLSLTVHLIVYYREQQAISPYADQKTLLLDTVRVKVIPCFYTVITTIVAFGSLLFSNIQPVMDFGWIMTIGIIIAFVMVFTLFPATLILLEAGSPSNSNDITDKITHFLVRMNNRYHRQILLLYAVFTVIAVIGMSFLSVENRFIDYFKSTTEIYQGMELIDKKLGGTTPLDVVIDPPAGFLDKKSESVETAGSDDWGEDTEEGITSTSYWFNTFRLEKVFRIHNYLDELPQTGKVLSLATTLQLLEHFDKQLLSDDFSLSILYKKLPDDVKQTLFQPYMTDDGNQIRFSIRVFESDPSLKRNELLTEIRTELVKAFDLEPQQLHLSGMLVLYNNMLQSLFKSQILTIAAVFLAIMVMFIILFRNLKIATVAIIPNIFAAGLMLGLMGWANIPLDLMTITIAAITIGIAVDDSIHYIHRFISEFQTDGDYPAAIERSHGTIGRAMYFTTVTVAMGFSVLVLSNFVPTIYFGVLTSFAMLIALLANLTLLPLLIIMLRPLSGK